MLPGHDFISSEAAALFFFCHRAILTPSAKSSTACVFKDGELVVVIYSETPLRHERLGKCVMSCFKVNKF